MQFFAWLVGPMEMRDVEVDFKGQQQVWRSGVHIKKCRYLEQAECKGMCVNMCKVRCGHRPRSEVVTFAIL